MSSLVLRGFRCPVGILAKRGRDAACLNQHAFRWTEPIAGAVGSAVSGRSQALRLVETNYGAGSGHYGRFLGGDEEFPLPPALLSPWKMRKTLRLNLPNSIQLNIFWANTQKRRLNSAEKKAGWPGTMGLKKQHGDALTEGENYDQRRNISFQGLCLKTCINLVKV
ncbi:uncharacterized protein V5649_012552 [Rhynchonycteris naso]